MQKFNLSVTSLSQLMTSLSSLRESSSPSPRKVAAAAPRRTLSTTQARHRNDEAGMWAELGSTSDKTRGRRPDSNGPRTPRSSSARRGTSETPGVLRRSASFSSRDFRSSELDECTFRPRIKALPAEYSSSSWRKRRKEEFLERVERWRIERERELERNVARDEEYALGECTFQPRISSNSRKAADLSRASDARSADQRLYEDDKNRRAAREARRSLDSSLRESKFADEHPFRPRLVSARNDSVKPRYSSTPRRRSVAPSPDERMEKKECTFAPNVNGVRDDMDLAKMYLSTGVFDRLSARRKKIEDDEDDRKSSTASSVAVEKTDVEKFLARQAAFDAKRARKVDDLRQSIQPRFRPSLATPNSKRPSTPTRSAASPSEQNGSNFMDRLAVSERRRQRRQQQLATTPQHRRKAGEYTFTPTISEFAAKRSSRRSVDEMSTGDALRRETSRRLLKLKAEHDEKRTNSFKPKLVAHQRPSAQSKLRLSSAPDTYLDRLKRESERRVEQRRRALDERDRRLLEDVTFEPQTTRCPTYIKRIARGMALAKKAADHHPKAAEDDRPGWR